MKDEIGKLTHGFNDMPLRLDDAFLRQKRFTANAAHELKTPLAVLKTGVQVLEADKQADLSDYQENAQNTLVSVNRLSHIVDDLLLLASAGEPAGNIEEEVLLDPLFEAIQSELAMQMEEQDMSCDIECKELSVIGNADMLYRAFFNLLENACKYGYKGGSIKVQASKGNNWISVCVKDDGPGIDKEHLPYIFDAFYRVDKSRSREMGGSGLGLSLVKTMIEAMGGSITAECDGKNGTSFVVKFPI